MCIVGKGLSDLKQLCVCRKDVSDCAEEQPIFNKHMQSVERRDAEETDPSPVHAS